MQVLLVSSDTTRETRAQHFAAKKRENKLFTLFFLYSYYTKFVGLMKLGIVKYVSLLKTTACFLVGSDIDIDEQRHPLESLNPTYYERKVQKSEGFLGNVGGGGWKVDSIARP